MKTEDIQEIADWFYKVEGDIETYPLVIAGVKLNYVNGHIEVKIETIDGFDEYTTVNMKDGVAGIIKAISDMERTLEEADGEGEDMSQYDIAYTGVNGEQYKRSDIMKLCNGNEQLVDIIIDNSLGFPPEVVLERLINEGDVTVSYEVNDNDSQTDEFGFVIKDGAQMKKLFDEWIDLSKCDVCDDQEDIDSQSISQYHIEGKTEYPDTSFLVHRQLSKLRNTIGGSHGNSDSYDEGIKEIIERTRENISKYKDKAVGPSIIRGTWLNPGIFAILKSSSREEDVYPPYTVGFNGHSKSEESIMANMNMPPYHQTLKVTEDPLVIKVTQLLMYGATIDQLERFHKVGLLYPDFDLKSYDDPDNIDLQLLIDYTEHDDFDNNLVPLAETVIALICSKKRSLVGTTTSGESNEYAVIYNTQHVVYIKDGKISCVITKR